MKEQSTFKEQVKFSQRILRSPRPTGNEHPDSYGLHFFNFRADSSRKSFLSTSCDRQPVAFSEEDPSSPKPDAGK